MKQLFIVVGIVLSLAVSVGIVRSAVVQEMHKTDRLMTEADDVTGNITLLTKNDTSTPGSSGCTPTAAAPTYLEGVVNYLSCTLIGALRVTLETLLFAEDYINQAFRVEGAAVRQTFMLGSPSGPTTATDATSDPFQLPLGMKTFQGVVSCTGTCVQTQEIRGGWTNTYADGDTVKVCTLTISGTTKASDWCATDRPFPFWFVKTTLSGGTTPLALLSVAY